MMLFSMYKKIYYNHKIVFTTHLISKLNVLMGRFVSPFLTILIFNKFIHIFFFAMHKNHHNSKFTNELMKQPQTKGAMIYFPSSRE